MPVLVVVVRNSNNAMEKMLDLFPNKAIKLICVLSWMCFFTSAEGQTITDTLESTHNIVQKDKRLDLLGAKMREYNEGLSQRTQLVNGYRLLLMKTSDRDAVMKLRTLLLQEYPEHKNYVVFIAPSLKLKFGNFANRADAEKMRKQLLDQKLVSGNIYILSEQVEMKPVDKNPLSKEER
jgi:hypothetical protein